MLVHRDNDLRESSTVSTTSIPSGSISSSSSRSTGRQMMESSDNQSSASHTAAAATTVAAAKSPCKQKDKDPQIGALSNFPNKLYKLLQYSQQEHKHEHKHEQELIISWSPHGKSFGVHNEEKFMKVVAPQFFPNQSSFRSFERMLNIWGFVRVWNKTTYNDKTFHHPFFVRGQPSWIKRIQRQHCKHARQRVKASQRTHNKNTNTNTNTSTNTNTNTNTSTTNSNITIDKVSNIAVVINQRIPVWAKEQQNAALSFLGIRISDQPSSQRRTPTATPTAAALNKKQARRRPPTFLWSPNLATMPEATTRRRRQRRRRYDGNNIIQNKNRDRRGYYAARSNSAWHCYDDDDGDDDDDDVFGSILQKTRLGMLPFVVQGQFDDAIEEIVVDLANVNVNDSDNVHVYDSSIRRGAPVEIIVLSDTDDDDDDDDSVLIV